MATAHRPPGLCAQRSCTLLNYQTAEATGTFAVVLMQIGRLQTCWAHGLQAYVPKECRVDATADLTERENEPKCLDSASQARRQISIILS